MTIAKLFKSCTWIKDTWARSDQNNCTPFHTDANCFCLDGAGIRVYGMYLWTTCFIREVSKAIRKLFPDRIPKDYRKCVVVFFNDHPATTFQDIKSVLREAKV